MNSIIYLNSFTKKKKKNNKNKKIFIFKKSKKNNEIVSFPCIICCLPECSFF